MAKVALLTVHGMGETQADYAADLEASVRQALGPAFGQVAFRAVYYQGLLQGNERALWDRTRQHARVHYDRLREFMLFGLADAVGLETGKEERKSVYTLAQVEIARTMLDARAGLQGNGPVVFITQSLGCQVLSSYFYDAQKAARGLPAMGIWGDIDRYAQLIAGRDLSDEEKTFMRGASFRRWITTGCNMPVFVAAHKSMAVLPIEPPPGGTADFRWINIYDPDDVLGWPLQPLSDGYARLVQDRAINSGHGAFDLVAKSWNPWSHTTYWRDGDVLGPLVRMLSEFL